MDASIETAPVKPTITIDDLDKIDVRVGRIVAVDDVEGSKKLIKMTVDFGSFTRTILSGMKEEREDCEAELKGKQALFVVNLAPRKMAGEVSEGMIYDIGYEDGILPALAMPERDVPNGVRAG
ncbi:tRNA-binding protein [Eggerthella sinensis]|uniref:tRNA-binding protein n=1 Tax=Eggerthella sinensis TaxID=242230 RepID=A0A3N0J2N5_9ACTN|nr:tRNA-binding protein [Eggerthella sinensis]RDB71059.1 tRNA-binding protein [Eggerthella sinensis]RNM43226.1 tRNA-binding protein [Eggerthella sinensis]